MSAITLTPSTRIDVLSCAYLLADSGVALDQDDALVAALAERGVRVTRYHPLWVDIKVEANNVLAGRAAARAHREAHTHQRNRQDFGAALIFGGVGLVACLASSAVCAAEPMTIPLADRVGWWAAWTLLALVVVFGGVLAVADRREKEAERRRVAERLDAEDGFRVVRRPGPRP